MEHVDSPYAYDKKVMGYYDIDDVLADSVDFPCKFQFCMPGLGYLEGNPGRAIEKNSKLNLPLWLARILAIVGGDSELNEVDGNIESEEPTPFVELLKPDIFSTKVINSAKASPTSLDVHSINAHFYSLAIKWIALFEDRELASILTDMLLERALDINSHASSVNFVVANTFAGNHLESHNASSEAGNKGSLLLLTLDEFEKNIYKQAHDSYKETKRWMVEK